MSAFVRDLALEQEAIVTKPIKALSLYNATKNQDARSNSISTKQAKKTSTMDSSYAKVSRTSDMFGWFGLIHTILATLKQYPLKICYIDDSNVNVAVGKKVSLEAFSPWYKYAADKGMCQILSKFGYKNVDVCYDGNQAVEAAEKTKYDLMLMDLQVRNSPSFIACVRILNLPAFNIDRCRTWTVIRLGN